jgi:hypothetical protein
MTAYNLHPGQFIPANELISARVAEGKARRQKLLQEVRERRRENYQRFREKRKIALEASKMLY